MSVFKQFCLKMMSVCSCWCYDSFLESSSCLFLFVASTSPTGQPSCLGRCCNRGAPTIMVHKVSMKATFEKGKHNRDWGSKHLPNYLSPLVLHTPCGCHCLSKNVTLRAKKNKTPKQSQKKVLMAKSQIWQHNKQHHGDWQQQSIQKPPKKVTVEFHDKNNQNHITIQVNKGTPIAKVAVWRGSMLQPWCLAPMGKCGLCVVLVKNELTATQSECSMNCKQQTTKTGSTTNMTKQFFRKF